LPILKICSAGGVLVSAVDAETLERVALHEAAHAGAALMLGRRVAHVEVKREAGPPGTAMGECRVPLDRDELCWSQVPIMLIPYILEGRRGWPPPFAQAKSEQLEALDHIIEGLGLEEINYERLVGLAKRIAASPALHVIRRAIASAVLADDSNGPTLRLEADGVHEVVANLASELKRKR
jgi:hypothetical protein